jgi:hypothetical protein
MRKLFLGLFGGAARFAGLRYQEAARGRCAAVVNGAVRSRMRKPMRAVSTKTSPTSNIAMRPATESMCRDSWFQQWAWPSLAPLGWDKSGRATVAPGSPNATSLVACSTWEITETFFPPKHDGKITTATFNSVTLRVEGAINGLCDSE